MHWNVRVSECGEFECIKILNCELLLIVNINIINMIAD